MTPLRLLLLCGVVAAGRRYLFTAPKAFFAGTPERVCLTLFDVPETGNLTLTFRRSESSPTFAQHTQQVSGVAGGSKETCFEVQTPELDDFTMWMGLEVTYPSAVNYTISGNQYISVFSNNAPEDHVFIQTDKYVYKPGQVVRFRVLSVNGKLRPISEPTSGADCAVFRVSGSDLGFGKTLDKPYRLEATAELTEDGTEVTIKGTKTFSIAYQELNLETDNLRSNYFKPGLPFTN
ncbi:alpha-1-macroglobulin-like isoform X2 [Pollicipes pollicipes]|uniref:alpha-1-macroglobulin-like isoform X2 n=1 Tax=Pollicipes pollicipes TaxID=41117 RepID=UPI0018858908|nr:alpha-1-macroglobulin-like isoform X2 [Pollicipes pollicipes]